MNSPATMPDPSPAAPWAVVARFLEKRFWLLLFLLMGIACCRIVATYHALSLTIDEPTHLAAGMELLATHSYQRDPQDPPLARVAEALGPWLAGARPQPETRTSVEGLTILARSGHVWRTIFLMRLGALPFFLLGCAVVCVWAWRGFGKPVALLAVFLYTWLPAVLGDAGLATTDMAAGATIGGAFLAALWWAKQPAWPRAAVAGCAAGLACLAKFSALGYLPAALAAALLLSLAIRRPSAAECLQQTKRRIPGLLLTLLAAGLTIWAGYGFSIGPAVLHHHELLVPAPEFVNGIHALENHNRVGHAAWLLGRFSYSGWWYYFPVALAVKTPIPVLLLAAAVARPRSVAAWLPLAYVGGILLVAIMSHIAIGIRHIEPVWIGLAIVAALGLRRLLEISTPLAGVAATALALWLLATTGWQHPDYLAYFNALAGPRPEHVLADSNYDWGQDLELLAGRLQRHGASQVSLADLDGVVEAYPERYAALASWYGLPAPRPLNLCRPDPGWNAVSINVEVLRHVPGSPYYTGGRAAWFDQVTPAERAGPLLLYDIPQGSTLQSSGCP